MHYKNVYSSDAKYLAASDVLIGDMSDINYEFLIFNRPIILLANNWVRNEIADIGVKVNISEIKPSIEDCLSSPNTYEDNRKLWLNKTHHKPNGKSSQRVLDKSVAFAGIMDPNIIFIHGNNDVLKNTVMPIYVKAKENNFRTKMISHYSPKKHSLKNIYISAHNELINFSDGVKIHVDHGNKGPGVSPFEYKINQWKENNFWSNTDLFITEGDYSYEKTRKCLGPFANKTIKVGFPRSDDYLRLNTRKNKANIIKELGFDPALPIITYAPAGKYSFPTKQGASLTQEVLKELQILSKEMKINVMVKLKYPRGFIFYMITGKIRRLLKF